MICRVLARPIATAATTVLGILLAGPAFTEPVVTLQFSGDSSNRLDIVVAGDGYTSAEMGKYAGDVNGFLAAMFAQQPWAEYRPLMNIYRADVISPQSGASHPERGAMSTTAFSASYNCGGLLRLVCVDVREVNAVIGRSFGAAQHDLVFIIVNDTAYGGSGGPISVVSLNPASVEIALHEIGHTLGLLGDEYTDQPPPCTIVSEPPFANVTVQTARDAIKWNAWIAPSTPLPTAGPSSGVPGIYVGAHYCPSGVYRPTFNSKMRTLGQPYEQVNTEQLVRRFYNFVTPLDGASPNASTVTIPAAGSVTFQVNPPALATHADTVTWQLDGATVAAGPSLVVPAAALPAGTHTLSAVIRDTTPFVRSDPSGLLQTTRVWTISGGVGVALPNPPSSLNASASGSLVTLTWAAPSGGAAPTDYVVEAGSAPGLADLANFSTGNAAVQFSAAGVGAGRYYVRVRSANGAGSSGPSNEVLLVVGGSCGGPPSVTSQVAGTTVTLSWSPSVGAASYQIEAGSAAGLTNLANIGTGSADTRFIATGVGAGTYFVRVRANTVCGVTAPSNEVIVVVQ